MARVHSDQHTDTVDGAAAYQADHWDRWDAYDPRDDYPDPDEYRDL